MDGPYETLAELDNGRVGGRLGIIHVNPVCDPSDPGTEAYNSTNPGSALDLVLLLQYVVVSCCQ